MTKRNDQKINWKSEAQKLLDGSDLNSMVKALNICAFNFQDLCLKKLPDLKSIRREMENRCLWLTDIGSAPFERPSPRSINLSDFRTLEQAEIDAGFSFNKLKFNAVVTADSLVITYKDKPVYEEPIYLMLIDDSDDETGFGSAEALFDDREDVIQKSLKEVYGKQARLKASNSYPVLEGTSDLDRFITDYLNMDDLDAVSALRLFLMLSSAKNQGELFIEHVSREWNSVDEIIDVLFREYINYCGISVGYRTCLWDSMVSVYQYCDADLDQDATVAMIEKRFDCDEFEAYRDVDIGMTSVTESITYQWRLYQQAEGYLQQALAVGVLCSARIYSMF